MNPASRESNIISNQKMLICEFAGFLILSVLNVIENEHEKNNLTFFNFVEYRF